MSSIYIEYKFIVCCFKNSAVENDWRPCWTVHSLKGPSKKTGDMLCSVLSTLLWKIKIFQRINVFNSWLSGDLLVEETLSKAESISKVVSLSLSLYVNNRTCVIFDPVLLLEKITYPAKYIYKTPQQDQYGRKHLHYSIFS